MKNKQGNVREGDVKGRDLRKKILREHIECEYDAEIEEYKRHQIRTHKEYDEYITGTDSSFS